MQRAPLRRQAGAATLVVTLVLFFVMTLVAAFASRNHLFEQRSSANQYHATQAFEAAEAGVEWAIAMLNSAQQIGADCRPGSGVDGKSFRERYLSVGSGGIQLPTTWTNAGQAAPLQAACVRNGGGWDCSCPASGHPALTVPADGNAAPAFSVQFEKLPQAGLVRMLATGCSSVASTCLAANSVPADATSRVQLTLGLVPGLATPPVAPMTVKDGVQAGAAALGLHNPDAASGGTVVHAGSNVSAPNARLTTAPGGATAAAVIESDAPLHALSAERLFASFFGVDKTTWTQQPAVQRVACQASCGDAIVQAVSTATGNRMIWVDGDLQLDGAIAIGSREQPVVIFASGAVRLRGPVVLYGAVYGASLEWSDSGAGGLLRGAAISESGYQGDAAADFFYDTAVLAALKGRTGSFARLPGSWKDF